MKHLKISTAQFENKSGDKDYNLGIIGKLAEQAKAQGAQIAAFHECSITGYTFARHLSKEELQEIAEPIPGPSVSKLVEIAKGCQMVLLAGLFEKDEENRIYNTYVCVDQNGVVARHRKIHPFISKHLSPGTDLTIFEVLGWKCGILICYDNNIPEYVRATKLLGANILFMPHVTMCTPSSRPGAGFVDPALWENRHVDPTSLRQEFDGLKGRSWLMKWLPARAYDNASYVVFSNPIGMDDDQLKNGCSMILDPFGDVLAECRTFEDSIATATIAPEKLQEAGGFRYLQARKPEIYGSIISKEHASNQKVAWLHKDNG